MAPPKDDDVVVIGEGLIFFSSLIGGFSTYSVSEDPVWPEYIPTAKSDLADSKEQLRPRKLAFQIKVGWFSGMNHFVFFLDFGAHVHKAHAL